MSSRVLQDARRIVVKVGSSLVTNEGRGLDEAAIEEWSRQLAALVHGDDGVRRELIMVSSGAVAEGMKRLGWTTRPKKSMSCKLPRRWGKWVWCRCTKPSCVISKSAAPKCC